MKYIVEKANLEEKKEVLEIYKNLIGEEGCTWDAEYPNIETIESDISNNGLYSLKIDNNLVGIASLIKEDKVYEEISKFRNPYLLTRVGIDKNYQNKGYSKILLNKIFEDAKKRKIDLIYLLVAENNVKAKNLYNSFSFKFCMNVYEHSRQWELYIKKI